MFLTMNCKLFAAAAMMALSFQPSQAQQRPKILALHGGDGNGEGFQQYIADLERNLPGYDFVYPNAGYSVPFGSGLVWMPDPPGGKGQPTTSSNIADESVAVLDRILEEQGPFDGIMGYSQGAAFVPVYLSMVPAGTFRFAMMFCGYLTETHLGLLDVVNEASPFGGIDSLIWIGEQDTVIPPSMTRATIPKFTSPTVISSASGGHVVPGASDPTFSQVVAFVNDGSGNVGDEPIVDNDNDNNNDEEKPEKDEFEQPIIDEKPDKDEYEKPIDENPPDVSCADSSDKFLFQIKKKGTKKIFKTCKWLKKKLKRLQNKPNKQIKLCNKKTKEDVKQKISVICPESCGLCK